MYLDTETKSFKVPSMPNNGTLREEEKVLTGDLHVIVSILCIPGASIFYECITANEIGSSLSARVHNLEFR